MGSYLKLRNELSEETRVLTKQEILLERTPGQGKGTEENCSSKWLTVSGFMVRGLVSRVSLANLSDSGSFLVSPRWIPSRKILEG